MSGETISSLIPRQYHSILRASGFQGEVSRPTGEGTDDGDVVEIGGRQITFGDGLGSAEIQALGINAQLAEEIDERCGDGDGVLEANELETFSEQHVARFAQAFGITEEQAWTLYGQSTGEDAFSTLSAESLETIGRNRTEAREQLAERLDGMPSGGEVTPETIVNHVTTSLRISEGNPILQNIRAYADSRIGGERREIPTAQDIANLIDRVYVASFLSSGGANAHQILNVPGRPLPEAARYAGNFTADSLSAALRGERAEDASEEEGAAGNREELMQQGAAAFRENNIQEALRIFTQVREIDGENLDPRVLTIIAACHHRLGDRQAAADALRLIPEEIRDNNPPQMLAELVEAYQTELESSDMVFGVEDPDESEGSEETTTVATTTTTTTSSTSAEAEVSEPLPRDRMVSLYRQGMEDYRARRYSRALAHFRQASEAMQTPHILIAIGNCHLRMNHLEQASQTLSSIISEYPQFRHTALTLLRVQVEALELVNELPRSERSLIRRLQQATRIVANSGEGEVAEGQLEGEHLIALRRVIQEARVSLARHGQAYLQEEGEGDFNQWLVNTFTDAEGTTSTPPPRS